MITYQNPGEHELKTKSLKSIIVVLSFLPTIGSGSGNAYRHTIEREAQDLVMRSTRIRHDAATLLRRTAEDTATAARRVLPTRHGLLARSTRNVEDFLANLKRDARDNYVKGKRSIRDACITGKRELEDLAADL